jgi:hypothetical protein
MSPPARISRSCCSMQSEGWSGDLSAITGRSAPCFQSTLTKPAQLDSLHMPSPTAHIFSSYADRLDSIACRRVSGLSFEIATYNVLLPYNPRQGNLMYRTILGRLAPACVCLTLLFIGGILSSHRIYAQSLTSAINRYELMEFCSAASDAGL